MFHHLGRFALPWTVVPTPLGKCYPKSSTTIIMQSVFTSNVSTSVYADPMNIDDYVWYSCISYQYVPWALLTQKNKGRFIETWFFFP